VTLTEAKELFVRHATGIAAIIFFLGGDPIPGAICWVGWRWECARLNGDA
jgi:hypothetical protein